MTVVADPSECSVQFKMTGTEKFTTSCDTAKAALVAASVNYANQAASKGTPAVVKVGDETISTSSRISPRRSTAAISKHGYPPKADPAQIDYFVDDPALPSWSCS